MALYYNFFFFEDQSFFFYFNLKIDYILLKENKEILIFLEKFNHTINTQKQF